MPIYKDKLMARDGFILEMPGDCARVTQKELENRAEIQADVGLTPEGVGIIRAHVGHSTYDLKIAKIDGVDVAVQDVIPKALQATHRQMHFTEPGEKARPQQTLMIKALGKLLEKEEAKEEGRDEEKIRSYREQIDELIGSKSPEIVFNAGSQVFDPVDRRIDAGSKAGDRVIEIGDEIYEENVRSNRKGFEGFTAILNLEMCSLRL